MSIVDKRRITEVTIKSVDSIPCSLINQKMIFSEEGRLISQPIVTPWPMEWVTEECRKYILDLEAVTLEKEAKIYSPEEPDQYVQVFISRYLDLDLGELLHMAACIFPKEEVLVDHSGCCRVRYEQLERDAQNLAKGLITIGVEKSENIGIISANTPEVVVAQFAIAIAGSAMIPLSIYEKEFRIKSLLQQMNVSTLILQDGLKSKENVELIYKICPELYTAVPGQLNAKALPHLRRVIVISHREYAGCFKWEKILCMGRQQSESVLQERRKQININDTVFIIPTSGTTGMPKGVMLTHKNIIENANALSKTMKLTEKDIICVQAPIFHCFGCNACVVTGILSGCRLILVNKFQSKGTLDIIEREKCTVVSGVPTMFINFINEMKTQRHDISSVRTGIVAGASCTGQMLKDIENFLGIRNIVVSYGLTETSPCITITNLDDPLDLKVNSVGKVISGVEVKIVNINTGKEVPMGEQGEIYAKGYNVMKGYYNLPEETAAAVDAEGWLHTGDIGFLQGNGYLTVCDRRKDIIIRSGENISPKEIENFLVGLKDVEEVSVVGVSDYMYGEEVAAFIRKAKGSNLTEEGMRKQCRGEIASNKIPAYVIFLEEFPTSETGKILKTKLKEMAVIAKSSRTQ